MTPRSRSQDLTADLLHDLADEESAPTVPAPSPSRSAPAPAAASPSPFVETALFLAPRAWRRPGVRRAGGSLSVSAGPVRLRIGRRPS
jgi:hypothetical protein